MCVHHWMIDSKCKGKCKLCGADRNFASPSEKLTKEERRLIRGFENAEYYMQGRLTKYNELL